MAAKVCGKMLTACDVTMLVLGSILILGGIALVVSRFPYKCVKGAIENDLVLRPNSTIVDEWIHPTVPIQMAFYVFNVTNGDDVVAGEKPVLSEHGPYVYAMTAPRKDISFYTNNTVSYWCKNKLIFQPHLSNGSEEDILFHINIPLITVSKKMGERSDTFSTLLQRFGAAEKFVNYVGDEDLVLPHTAKEIIFGYREPMFQSARSWLRWVGKDFDPIFGPFHDFNNSADGVYLVDTGRVNFTDANKIQRWNGYEYLPYWSTRYANMINGTDGSFLKPEIKRGDVRYLYESHMCRSIKLEYQRDTSVHGVKTYRYHYAPDLLANATVQPDNAGFCVPPGNCLDSGVLNTAPCGEGAPIVLSFPHLYLAAERYRDEIIGIAPNGSLHDSVIDVEPLTGASLRSKRSLQLNVHMTPSSEFTQLSRVRSMIFPYFWLRVKVDVGEDKVRSLNIGVKVLQFSKYLGYIVIVVGCLFLTKPFCKCRKKSSEQSDPLLAEEM